MKFELFGKLRDNGGGSSGPQDDFEGGGFDGGSPGVGDEGMQIGDGLDRTVENMFNQGYSEEEIKDELSGQYSPDEIQEAITNAVATSAQGNGSSGGPEPMTPYQGGEDDAVSPVDEGFGGEDPESQPAQESDLSPQDPAPIQKQGGGEPQQQAPAGGANVDSSTEELVETIVAENLDTMFDQFEDVFNDIESMKERLDDLEERVHDLEVRDDEDQQQFVQKVDEMEEHIDSYQSRIGGLEKAFQQVLPSLVDNVQDLTGLVQEMKKENNIETDRDVPSSDLDDMEMEDWN